MVWTFKWTRPLQPLLFPTFSLGKMILLQIHSMETAGPTTLPGLIFSIRTLKIIGLTFTPNLKAGTIISILHGMI